MTSDLQRLVETQRRNKSASYLRPREMRDCGASLATNGLARRIETKIQQKINRMRQLPLKRFYRRGGMFRPFSTAGRERIRLRHRPRFQTR